MRNKSPPPKSPPAKEAQASKGQKSPAATAKEDGSKTTTETKPKHKKRAFVRNAEMPDYIKKDFERIRNQSRHDSIRPASRRRQRQVRDAAPVAKTPVYFGLKRNQFNPNMEFKAIYDFITEKYPKVKKEDARQIAGYLVDYGKEHDLDPKFVAAVMARESAFNHRAVSVTGAKGLGQIKDFNYPSLKITDPFDIKQNVSGTTQYLRRLKKRWANNQNQARLTLASYFKGPNHVTKQNGVLDAQTHRYVDDILAYYDDIKAYRNRNR